MGVLTNQTGWWLVVLLACTSSGNNPDKGSSSTDAGDADADTDADADADADADVDADADFDSATAALMDVDCAEGAYPTPSPEDTPETGCVTATLACNTTITATTVGGSTHYDLAHWTAAQCAGSLLNEDPTTLDAPERVYEFVLEPQQHAEINLYTPCADLELRQTDTIEVCADSHGNCTQATDQSSSDHQRLIGLAGGPNGNRYEIVVDGLLGATGNFRLAATCE